MIELYCTGRGRHPRRDLYRLYQHDGTLYLAPRLFGRNPQAGAGPRVGPPQAAGVRGAQPRGIGHRNSNVPCPACRRSTALSTTSLARLLDAGLSEVDISALPF